MHAPALCAGAPPPFSAMNLAPGEFEGGSHDQSAAQNWLAGLRLLPLISQPARGHRPLVQLSAARGIVFKAENHALSLQKMHSR